MRMRSLSGMQGIRAFVLVAATASGAAAQAPGGGPPPTVVEVATARRAQLEQAVSLVGTAVPRHDAVIAAEVEGRVAAWTIEEGDTADANAVIVELDTRELETDVDLARARVAEAEAQRRAAEARLERARLERERSRSLADEALASAAALETAVAEFEAQAAQVDSWKAQLAERRAALARAELDLARAAVRAPFAGSLVEQRKEVGEWVRAGDGVARWAATGSLEVDARVSGVDFPYVQRDTAVTIVSDAFPTESYTGRVVRRVAVADPVTRTYPITIAVDPRPTDASGPALMAGALVRAEVRFEGRPDRLVVPKDALVYRGNTTLVYVSQRDPESGATTVDARHVKVGVTKGDQVEVLEGVVEGDDVVVVGNDGLRPGAPVQIRNR